MGKYPKQLPAWQFQRRRVRPCSWSSRSSASWENGLEPEGCCGGRETQRSGWAGAAEGAEGKPAARIGRRWGAGPRGGKRCSHGRCRSRPGSTLAEATAARSVSTGSAGGQGTAHSSRSHFQELWIALPQCAPAASQPRQLRPCAKQPALRGEAACTLPVLR